MNFAHLAQYIDLVVASVLIAKLVSLQLNRLYWVFAALVAADLLGSIAWITRSFWFLPFRWVDYRLLWVTDRVVAWIFTFWTVALLLSAILAQFPGILRLSRNLLRYSWVAAFVIGMCSAVPEYNASAFGLRHGWINTALAFGVIGERVVVSVSLLAMLAVLCFLLWFPVEIPRNLAYFAIGFIIDFAVRMTAYLANSFWSHDLYTFVSTLSAVIDTACYAFWIAFLSREGETVLSRLNIRWEAQQQELLLEQLEGLNRSLLRTARR